MLTLEFKNLCAVMIGMVFWAGAAQASDCHALTDRAYPMYAQQDYASLSALVHSDQALVCPEQRFQLQRWSAALLWNQALALHQAGADIAQQEAVLLQVLDYAPLWQAHAALGDLASERNDHAQATRHYQQALDAIGNPALTPNEPVGMTERLFRKAQASRMLATDYVPTTRSRSGEPTGLASTAIRSFGVREVALPVQFEFGSVAFTLKGREAAEDLLDYLNRQGVTAITLIGHTDPVGSVAYNERLSLRRAQAVAEYLRTHGFSGQINTQGRGPHEPFVVDDPGRYTQEQQHQLHRRVELRRD